MTDAVLIAMSAEGLEVSCISKSSTNSTNSTASVPQSGISVTTKQCLRTRMLQEIDDG